MGIGDTKANLGAAADGETTSGLICMRVLQKPPKRKASRSLPQNSEWSARSEKHHEERYRALLKNLETAHVFEKSEVKVWECRNCGHICVGVKAPEVCPVCNHPQSYFEVHAENY